MPKWRPRDVSGHLTAKQTPQLLLAANDLDNGCRWVADSAIFLNDFAEVESPTVWKVRSRSDSPPLPRSQTCDLG